MPNYFGKIGEYTWNSRLTAEMKSRNMKTADFELLFPTFRGFKKPDVAFQVARMRVPKMVKNGFNSVLQTSAGSRRLVAARNSGTNAKSKTVPKSQKANKNHFRPI